MKYDNKKAYKWFLCNKSTKVVDLMKNITMPKSVYKYRSFGAFEDHNWCENPYWKESMEGEVFFSSPRDFNSNDPNDCRLNVNVNVWLQKEFNCSKRGKIIEKAQKEMQGYIDSVQSNLRVGCFTTVDCCRSDMWNDEYFGQNGMGYCVEYEVLPELFNPGRLVFLKVLYDNAEFDATELICNLRRAGEDVQKTYQMICQGYAPFLIKPKKYSKEKEWRLIIPSNHFTGYFGRENCYKRNMSKAVRAIYLGPKYRQVPQWEEKRDYAISVADKLGAVVYEVYENENQNENVCVSIKKNIFLTDELVNITFD